MTNFGSIARTRREQLGLSQNMVANMACCDRKTVKDFELNRRVVGIDYVSSILNVLGMELVLKESKNDRSGV